MNNSFCPYCGTNTNGNNFCPNCGNSVQQQSMINQQVQNNMMMNQPMQNNMMVNQQQNMGFNYLNNNMVTNANVNNGFTNKRAIWGLVLTIISFFVFGFLSIVGLCLSIGGLDDAKNNNGKGKSLAIVGIVMGVIFVGLYIVTLVLKLL